MQDEPKNGFRCVWDGIVRYSTSFAAAILEATKDGEWEAPEGAARRAK